jgi:hypothetical protein
MDFNNRTEQSDRLSILDAAFNKWSDSSEFNTTEEILGNEFFQSIYGTILFRNVLPMYAKLDKDTLFHKVQKNIISKITDERNRLSQVPIRHNNIVDISEAPIPARNEAETASHFSSIDKYDIARAAFQSEAKSLSNNPIPYLQNIIEEAAMGELLPEGASLDFGVHTIRTALTVLVSKVNYLVSLAEKANLELDDADLTLIYRYLSLVSNKFLEAFNGSKIRLENKGIKIIQPLEVDKKIRSLFLQELKKLSVIREVSKKTGLKIVAES